MEWSKAQHHACLPIRKTAHTLTSGVYDESILRMMMRKPKQVDLSRKCGEWCKRRKSENLTGWRHSPVEYPFKNSQAGPWPYTVFSWGVSMYVTLLWEFCYVNGGIGLYYHFSFCWPNSWRLIITGLRTVRNLQNYEGGDDVQELPICTVDFLWMMGESYHTQSPQVGSQRPTWRHPAGTKSTRPISEYRSLLDKIVGIEIAKPKRGVWPDRAEYKSCKLKDPY